MFIHTVPGTPIAAAEISATMNGTNAWNTGSTSSANVTGGKL
jgi:hypothetical protein